MTLVIDFGNATVDDYKRFAAKIESLDVSVLINNVGVSHALPTMVHESPEGEDDGIININCLATVKVTRVVLPRLIAHANQGKGGQRSLILNVGSFAGVVPSPYLSTYSGSKAFLSTWSRALSEEMKIEKTKVDVWCLNAYFIVSALSKIRRPNYFTPLPGPFVKHTLAHLGRRGGAHEPNCFSLWPSHALTNWVITRIGKQAWWISYTGAMQKGIRKRALKRSQKAAKTQ